MSTSSLKLLRCVAVFSLFFLYGGACCYVPLAYLVPVGFVMGFFIPGLIDWAAGKENSR